MTFARISAITFVVWFAVACAAGARSGGSAIGNGSGDFLGTTTFGFEAEVHPEELTRHARGFYFRDVEQGAGTEASGGRTVHVSYVMRLSDGREVDRAESSAPIHFRVGDESMIPALDAGVRGMRVGGTRQLVIPARLGYGARSAGPVPPNSVLVMMVRLERVE